MKKHLSLTVMLMAITGCSTVYGPQSKNTQINRGSGLQVTDDINGGLLEYANNAAAIAAARGVPVRSMAMQAAYDRLAARNNQAHLAATNSANAVNSMHANTWTKTSNLAPNHWSDVSKIRDEATRLSVQVSEGKITKVQAAQYLNRYRKSLVGRNPVDDSMYEVYLRSAVDSQRGQISTQQSKLYIQNALKEWQQRWPNMQNKPNNPAFTNFFMGVMNMKPLQ